MFKHIPLRAVFYLVSTSAFTVNSVPQHFPSQYTTTYKSIYKILSYLSLCVNSIIEHNNILMLHLLKYLNLPDDTFFLCTSMSLYLSYTLIAKDCPVVLCTPSFTTAYAPYPSTLPILYSPI